MTIYTQQSNITFPVQTSANEIQKTPYVEQGFCFDLVL